MTPPGFPLHIVDEPRERTREEIRDDQINEHLSVGKAMVEMALTYQSPELRVSAVRRAKKELSSALSLLEQCLPVVLTGGAR